MSSPRDTRKVPPLVRVAAALGSDPLPRQIEAEERQGGVEMLRATTVPTKGSDKLEALGFKLGEIVEGDPIFRHVEAPEGWTRAPGENPYGYWTYFEDEQGFRRVAMFYKAAFYDRDANLSVIGVPTTKAQDETIGRIFDALYSQSRGKDEHFDREVKLVEGGRREAVFVLEKINRYPEPSVPLWRRTVTVEPDGSVVADKTEELR